MTVAMLQVMNNMISAGVGMIPFAGDIILGIWKANSRYVAGPLLVDLHPRPLALPTR